MVDNETTIEPENKIGKKILIVDDDMFLLDMYALKFQQAGFDVMTASDANAALVKLRELDGDPDLMLLDIVMPGMDGLELLEVMQKEGLAQKTAKIVLSNMGDQEDAKRGDALGACSYIVKANNTPSEVLEKVKEAMVKYC